MKIYTGKKMKGQAMTEMIVFLPLLAILILLIMWIGNVMMNYAFITQAARYGSDLIQFRAYGYGSKATATKVKRGIEGFLGADLQKNGRRVKKENLTIKIVDSEGKEIENFPEFPNVKSADAALFTNLTMKTIGVEVYYQITLPKFFKAFEGLMSGGSSLPGLIRVGARSEIIGLGTGYNVLSKSLPTTTPSDEP